MSPCKMHSLMALLLYLKVLSCASDTEPTGKYVGALRYLARYGYLDQVMDSNGSVFDTFQKSIKKFQKFFGLTESGVLDNSRDKRGECSHIVTIAIDS